MTRSRSRSSGTWPEPTGGRLEAVKVGSWMSSTTASDRSRPTASKADSASADTITYLGAAIRLYRDTFPPPGPARRPRQGSGRRRPTAHRQDRRAVQGGLRLPAAPVVLDPRQAVHPRADHLRHLRQAFQPLGTAPGHQQHGREPPRQAAEVKRRRGSGPEPDRPGGPPARIPAPLGGREACLAGAGRPPPARP
jgi:hypothetical protein